LHSLAGSAIDALVYAGGAPRAPGPPHTSLPCVFVSPRLTQVCVYVCHPLARHMPRSALLFWRGFAW
jgi:hypothetical protein